MSLPWVPCLRVVSVLCLVLSQLAWAQDPAQEHRELLARAAGYILGQRETVIAGPNGQFRYDEPLVGRLPAGTDIGQLVVELLVAPVHDERLRDRLQGRALVWVHEHHEMRARPVVLDLAKEMARRPRIQLEVCNALGAVCGDEGFEILKRMANSTSGYERQDAASGLCSCGPRAIPTLERMLNDTDVIARGVARRALEELRQRQAEAKSAEPGKPPGPSPGDQPSGPGGPTRPPAEKAPTGEPKPPPANPPQPRDPWPTAGAATPPARCWGAAQWLAAALASVAALFMGVIICRAARHRLGARTARC